MNTKYKVGYLDESASARNSVRQYLKNDFEIILFDIEDSTTINSILDKIKDQKLDLIIIDFRLNETGFVSFNGGDVSEAILNKWPHFPIMMLTSYENEAINQVDNVNIINGKDIFDGENQEKVDIFINKIKSNINRYYTHIKNAEIRICELAEKKLNTPLTLTEEEEYSKLFIFLDEIDPENKAFPSHMMNPENVSQLNDMISTAKEILEELKKRK